MAKLKAKSKTVQSKVLGRPTLYKPEYCEMVVSHLSQGYSIESFAGLIDVHRDSIYEWKSKHPIFSDSIKRGIDKSLLYWEKLGMAGTLGKIKGFNPATYIFTMKNRFGWTDRLATDVNANVSVVPTVILDVLDESSPD